MFGLSPAGMQVFVTWALAVVPSGMSLRGRDIALDMRLSAVSGETAGSEDSDPMALGLSDPLA